MYEGLEELGRFLGEYEQLKDHDPGRAHALQHLILEAITETRLDNEIRVTVPGSDGKDKKKRLADLTEYDLKSVPFDEIAAGAHGALSLVRNT